MNKNSVNVNKPTNKNSVNVKNSLLYFVCFGFIGYLLFFRKQKKQKPTAGSSQLDSSDDDLRAELNKIQVLSINTEVVN